MQQVTKGSKTDLVGGVYDVRLTVAPDGLADGMAVLLGPDGKVRSDEDFVFFNNPVAPGVQLTGSGSLTVTLDAVPADVETVLVAASTEAQGVDFSALSQCAVAITGRADGFAFAPPALTTETVLQLVSFYRRAGRWRLNAIGQGYSEGLAAFARDHGIVVDDDEAPPAALVQQAPAYPPQAPAYQPPHSQPAPASWPSAPQPASWSPQPQAASWQAPAAAPQPASGPPPNLQKVRVSITKDSPSKTATIDLRKSRGEPGWALTVGLEWDGRGAVYDRDGRVQRYGEGDLDVYFFCRNEQTGDYVVLSGENGHRGDLATWPFILHHGDSRGPGSGSRPAVEQVTVLPNENGDLLVNVYQSVDNGAGAIDTFGRPRVAIRYGKAGPDGMPGPDADEIVVHVGNGKNSFWATIAHIDVQDGILKVDGETRYSRAFSERMPILDRSGSWVRGSKSAPTGRSKKAMGVGLSAYSGRCP